MKTMDDAPMGADRSSDQSCSCGLLTFQLEMTQVANIRSGDLQTFRCGTN